MLREDILDLREAWVQHAIMERFQGYTHQNALRLHRIDVAHDDCIVCDIVCDLQLVAPDVAVQVIADHISDELRELLPWPHSLEVASPWREVRMLTIDAPESAEGEIAAYIEAVRRSQSDNDG
jgi:hypothetical protein